MGHVLYPQFGLEVDYAGKLVELGDKTRGLKFTGFERELIKRELYAETSGIGDLDDMTRPMGIVGEQNRDGLRELWGLESRIREFKLYEINKHYGYNLTEFLSLPRHIVELILTEQRDEEKRARAAREKAEQEAKKRFNAPADLGKMDQSIVFGGFNTLPTGFNFK